MGSVAQHKPPKRMSMLGHTESCASVGLGLVLAIGLSMVPSAVAFPTFRDMFPNGYSLEDHPGLGHVSPTGQGALNEFGEQWNRHNLKWTKAFCNEDTDRDGQSNGLE